MASWIRLAVCAFALMVICATGMACKSSNPSTEEDARPVEAAVQEDSSGCGGGGGAAPAGAPAGAPAKKATAPAGR